MALEQMTVRRAEAEKLLPSRSSSTWGTGGGVVAASILSHQRDWRSRARLSVGLHGDIILGDECLGTPGFARRHGVISGTGVLNKTRGWWLLLLPRALLSSRVILNTEYKEQA